MMSVIPGVLSAALLPRQHTLTLLPILLSMPYAVMAVYWTWHLTVTSCLIVLLAHMFLMRRLTRPHLSLLLGLVPIDLCYCRYCLLVQQR